MTVHFLQRFVRSMKLRIVVMSCPREESCVPVAFKLLNRIKARAFRQKIKQNERSFARLQ
jgi:hypothetical protein